MFEVLKNNFASFAFPKLLEKGFFPFFFKISGIFFGFLTAFLVSKDYGAEGWGIFSLISTAAMFCIYFGKLGFDTALLKFTAQLEAEKNRKQTALLYYRIAIILVPICAVLTFMIIYYAQDLAIVIFHKQHLTNYIKLGAWLILPSIFCLVHSEGLRGLKYIGKYSFLQNTGVYLVFICIYFLSHNFIEKSTLAPLQIFILSTYTIFFLSLYWWLRRLVTAPDSKRKSVSLKNFFKVSMPMFWSNLMIIIIGWTDTILLGIYDQTDDIGIYNVALKISNVVIMPLLVANSIVAPYYAELSARDQIPPMAALVRKTSKFIIISSIPLYLCILVFPDFILSLFGQEYEKGKQILIILASGQLFNTFCGTTDTLLQMTGNEKAFRNIIGIGTLLNVGLNWILIPVYGSLGAAVTNCFSLVVWNIIGLIYIKKSMGITMIYNPFLKTT